jgi:hypothetical protein
MLPPPIIRNMNQSSSHLVLSWVTPSQISLERYRECQFVFVNGNIAFSKNLIPLQGMFLGQFLSDDDYKVIDRSVSEMWDLFCIGEQARCIPDINCFKYIYANHLTPLLIFQQSLHNMLHSCRPDKVTILGMNPFHSPLCIINTLHPKDVEPHFVEWASSRILVNSIKNYGATILSCADDGRALQHPFLKTSFAWCIERLVNVFSRRADDFQRLFQRLVESVNSVTVLNSSTDIKKVLLITQPRKSVHLRHFLKMNRVNFVEMSLAEFCAFLKIDVCANNPEYQLNLPDSSLDSCPISFLEQWMLRVAFNQSKYCEYAFNRYFTRFRSPLITDAEYSSIVNLLSQKISRIEGWKICSIPEGASNNFTQTYYSRFFFEEHSNLIRGFCSQKELIDFNEHYFITDRHFVCGYSTSVNSCRYLAPVIRFLLLSTIAQSKLRKIAYINVPFLYSQWWSYRATHEPIHNKYRSMIDLIKQLSLDNYFIVASVRGCTRRFMESFDNIIYFSSLHWSILARVADICFVYDSSIGPEILNLSRPVVKWRPEYYVSVDMFSYLNDLVISNYQEVTDSGQILASARDLIEGIVPQQSGLYLSSPDYSHIIPYLP